MTVPKERLNGSGGRRVFLQRQMSPGVLIVFEVCLKNAPQGSFIKYDYVVQALSSQ
jgi:hypothetical protein